MRFSEIDLIKGLAVINMVIFHIFYLGEYMNKLSFNTSSGLLRMMAKFAHTTFIICMGVNSYFSYQSYKKKNKKKMEFYKKNLIRFVKFSIVACLVSLTSYLAFGTDMFIKFGIFHFMALATLVVGFFVDKPTLTLISIPIIHLLFKLLENKNVINNNIGFALGLNYKYSSLDHFAFLKWFPFVLFGTLIGRSIYSMDHEIINKVINNSIFLNLISKIGSKSLEIYLIHFPLIYFYFLKKN